jgi:hypothetical protein
MLDLRPKYISNYIFKGHGIAQWFEYVGDGHRTRQTSIEAQLFPDLDNSPAKPPTDHNATGVMTKGATKRIRKYLDLWYNAINAHRQTYNARLFKHRHFLTFVTLTLPATQTHSDEFIKRYVLWPWLEIIKRYYGVQEYIWRAEKQKNGNIHFHILIDKFIKHELIRFHWNYHLAKYGYISAYADSRAQLAPLELALLKNFKAELEPCQCKGRIDQSLKSMLQNRSLSFDHRSHLSKFCKYLSTRPAGVTFAAVIARIKADQLSGFNNPNSTDIHAPAKIKNLVSYVVKYMSKKQKGGVDEIAVSGRCWGRSDGLNKLFYFTTTECSETERVLQSKVMAQIGKLFKGDFFSFTRFNLYQHLRTLSAKLADNLHQHFLLLYSQLYPDKQLVFSLDP